MNSQSNQSKKITIIILFLSILGLFIFNLITVRQMSNMDKTQKESNEVNNNLTEKLFVERYIRDNINNISEVKPVLGGIWYVTSISIDSLSNKGKISYEDGHVEIKAQFTYNYQDSGEITIVDIQKVE
jgi:hypothetical protein